MPLKSEKPKPESQCPDMEEREQSASPHIIQKPHVRACESCRARKVRCLPEDPISCQRCARSGRECVYTAPEKRRRRKRTDTRVAELEQMVQMLAARLEGEQRARIEQRQDKKHSPQLGNNPLHGDSRQPASVQDQSSPKEEGLHRETTRHVNRDAAASSSQHQAAIISPSMGSPLSSMSVKSSDAPSTSHHRPSPNATNRTFWPSPSLDCTEKSPIPASLQIGPWPRPNTYLSPSMQQASWNGDLYSPHPSPSHSVSLASTASPQTEESWPSPGQDFASLYPESYLHTIDDKTNLPLQDPSTWWMESDGNMANQAGFFDAVAIHPYVGSGQSQQQWDFPCTETLMDSVPNYVQ
ncbi:MAG: hypothetical protein Q9184_006178 [Pyrenodesmia sp. 2 TL-2023]